MADVTITIGDRRHTIGCRDGEEDHLRRLASMLDERWPIAQRVSGGLSGERTMLLVALMLADALDEAEHRPVDGAETALLARVADKLEALAQSLEEDAASA